MFKLFGKKTTKMAACVIVAGVTAMNASGVSTDVPCEDRNMSDCSSVSWIVSGDTPDSPSVRSCLWVRVGTGKCLWNQPSRNY